MILNILNLVEYYILYYIKIKIIHDDGYNHKERQMYRPIVNCNVVQSLVSIIKAMQLLSIQYSSETVATEASAFITTVKGIIIIKPTLIEFLSSYKTFEHYHLPI